MRVKTAQLPVSRESAAAESVAGLGSAALNAMAPERGAASPEVTSVRSATAPAAPDASAAVREVLGMSVQHLGGLPLATTLLCTGPRPTVAPWLITTAGAVFKQAQAACVPVFSGGGFRKVEGARGEESTRVRTYGELGSIALAVFNDRAYPDDLGRWCAAKSRGAWQLSEANALGALFLDLQRFDGDGGRAGWPTIGEVLWHLQASCVGVGVGEAEGLELLEQARKGRVAA
jgi:hypothetical protein